MKKVAILYSGSKTGGGVDTYLTNLFKYADNEKVKLVLFSLGDWALTERFKREKYLNRTFSGKRIRLATVFDISSNLRNEGFDLIVSQGVVANAYARTASMLSGVPSLVTVHSNLDLDYDNAMIRMAYKLSDFILRWRTKKYIVVSKYLAKIISKGGINEKKIDVIYNGVEASKNLSAKKENKRIMLGSVGRLHPVKNYIGLVAAMHKLSEDGYDLTIWGEGNERPNLEAMIQKHDLELTHNVFLPGRIENIWEAFASIDIYLQPSFSEGFGLSVVEAQMAGLPVVVSPGGALPELVRDGETGLVANGFGAEDIVEAVLRYYEDPKLMAGCASMGQKEAIARFDVNKWADLTIKAYLEAAK